VDAEKKDFIMAHLEQMVEVALRVRLFGGADGPIGELNVSEAQDESIKESKQAATLLLDNLEKKVGSASLIGQYAETQRRLQATKAERRRVLASEAVKDPKGWATKKVRQHALPISASEFFQREFEYVCFCVYACLCVYVSMRVCVFMCLCVYVFMYLYVSVYKCVCDPNSHYPNPNPSWRRPKRKRNLERGRVKSMPRLRVLKNGEGEHPD
jgi:hypothetical protein